MRISRQLVSVGVAAASDSPTFADPGIASVFRIESSFAEIEFTANQSISRIFEPFLAA